MSPGTQYALQAIFGVVTGLGIVVFLMMCVAIAFDWMFNRIGEWALIIVPAAVIAIGLAGLMIVGVSPA